MPRRFQLFDGTQAVVTGVLRGIGETRTPMIINVIGHWLFGLPVGYVLCFWYAWGVIGLVGRPLHRLDLHRAGAHRSSGGSARAQPV